MFLMIYENIFSQNLIELFIQNLMHAKGSSPGTSLRHQNQKLYVFCLSSHKVLFLINVPVGSLPSFSLYSMDVPYRDSIHTACGIPSMEMSTPQMIIIGLNITWYCQYPNNGPPISWFSVTCHVLAAKWCF